MAKMRKSEGKKDWRYLKTGIMYLKVGKVS